MAQTKVLQQSFNGGEVTPEFFSRIDDVKRQNGVQTLRNLVAIPQGPAVKRPGTTFVREGGDSTNKIRLIPFVYSVDQSVAVELGHSYIRFHTGGGTLLYPESATAWNMATAYYAGDFVTRLGDTYQALATNTNEPPESEPAYWRVMPASGEYEIASPYDADDIFDIHYVQSNDVLTLVHPDYAPRELRRYGAQDWRLEVISFAPTLSAPTGLVHDISKSVGTGGAEIYYYKVTAVGQEQADESLVSAVSKTPYYTVLTSTQANPCRVIMTTTHNLVVGQTVTISGIVGMTEINGTFYVKTVNNAYTTNDAIELMDANGNNIDSTGYGAYVSGGSARGDGLGNDLLTTGNKNVLSWTAVSGAVRYNVYKLSNGLYGYIGQTDATTFTDDNIAADISRTAPESNTPFSGSGNYPRAVTYFEQRRIFAGTTNYPQNIWMTRTGTESNLNYSIPSRDDDAISFRVASRENHTIRHLVPVSDIMALTNSGEWRITSINGDAITPSTISVRPQSYVGASNVQPAVINNWVVYAEGRGGHVREMSYSLQANGYTTNDLSIRSPHLFDQKSITDMAYVRAPFPICWFVNDDGELLGLTYVPEQEVRAWHRHDTDGLFESVCAIPEGSEDAIYLVVKRNINGSDVRYIERMASRFFVNPEDAFFVDCGATYDGAATDTITGLSHLEGETVSVLADGAVHTPVTVTSGSITLDYEASLVHVGLPITSDLETLPIAVGVEAYGQGRQKNINAAYLRLYRTSGIKAGPTVDRLTDYPARGNETPGTPADLVSEEIKLVIGGLWSSDGTIVIRHDDPLPLTLVSITLEVVVG